MPLADVLNQRFGVRTQARENPGSTAMVATPLSILGNNPNRLAFVVVNLSSNTIFIAPARDVSTTKGIRLNANGGAATALYDEDFHMVGWEWFGVADVAGPSTIYVLEVVEYQPTREPSLAVPLR